MSQIVMVGLGVVLGLWLMGATMESQCEEYGNIRLLNGRQVVCEVAR